MKRNDNIVKIATLIAIFGIFILCNSNTATAKRYDITKGHTMGSSITSVFNYSNCEESLDICSSNPDEKTTVSTFQGEDDIQDVFGTIVSEYTANVHQYCVDFEGTPGIVFEVATAQGVLNYKKEKGQVFVQISLDGPNEGCLVPTSALTATYSLVIGYDINGGTGEFKDATGYIESRTTGVLLYNDLTQGHFNQFGSIDSNYTGYLDTPE